MISMVLTTRGGITSDFSTNGRELYIQKYDNNPTSPDAFPWICMRSIAFPFLTLDLQIIVEAEAVRRFPARVGLQMWWHCLWTILGSSSEVRCVIPELFGQG